MELYKPDTESTEAYNKFLNEYLHERSQNGHKIAASLVV